MTITTNRGKTFDVNWAWAMKDSNRLMIELPDKRSVSEIAEDFDGLTRIDRKSKEEGDKVYTGYTMLTRVIKDTEKGTALVTLERGDGHG